MRLQISYIKTGKDFTCKLILLRISPTRSRDPTFNKVGFIFNKATGFVSAIKSQFSASYRILRYTIRNHFENMYIFFRILQAKPLYSFGFCDCDCLRFCGFIAFRNPCFHQNIISYCRSILYIRKG